MSSHYLQFQKVAIDRVERVKAKLGLKDRKHHTSQASAASSQHDRSQLLATLKTGKSTPTDTIERLHAKDLPLDTFLRKHDKLCRPVVIQGLLDEWKALERWSLYNLVSKHSDDEFLVGRDQNQNSVTVKMKYFAYYLKEYRDPSPFQIADDLASGGKRRLRDDYEVPSYFKDDIFRYARESDLPPTRTFNLGPPLAGDRIQTNPLHCNLWSALVHGSRRWCLFPHHVPQDLLCNDHRAARKDRRLETAVAWFERIYTKTQSSRWPRYFKPLEILQAAGEVVFVPAGWWYVVINLDVCVVISHHHCSASKLAQAWPKLTRSNKKLERAWFEALRRRRPELAALVPRKQKRRSRDSYSDAKTADSSATSCSSDVDKDGSDEVASDNS
ncbi:bifunctional arginine demethylase and lysyl-hydroxylase PSR-like [Dermacentor andersoni]|uniref:bifunctional arginine demethylase and lysyl-hydroxylase PSR-like n=1 Tax=Dermacentor andersoni TaxID=34620 RepID=UPI002415EB96|nr:bifunctional arginine demethylase and lysyl-hydroxylase JMJD6-A-like [Dermacentor andersoni]